MPEAAVIILEEQFNGLDIGTLLLPSLDNENCPIEQPHIIIFADDKTDRIFAVNLERDIRPSIFSYAELTYCLEEKVVLKGRYDLPHYMKIPDSYIPEVQRKKRDEKMDRIRPILENLEEYIRDPYGKNFVQSIVKRHKCSKATLHRDLNRFWRLGCHPNAFLRKPGTGKVTNRTYTAKPGPNNETGKVRTALDIKNVHRAIRKFYAKSGPRMYLDTVYQKCLDHFYSDIVYDAETRKTTYARWDESRLITEWQFRDIARSYRNERKLEIIKAQGLEAEYAKNEKPSDGSLHDYYDKGPGYYYQMDETPYDVELVCQFDPTRKKRVGKATVYVVRDMSSRAFVGLYITFKNPSADTARALIFNTFRDKQTFCSELGIKIGKNDWPMKEKCRNIFCDNGEMKAELSRCFSKDSDITVYYNKEGHSQDKGLVERAFRLLHDAVKGQVAGYSPNNVPDHIKKLLRHRALLNITELYQILIMYIIIYNNYSPNDGIERSKEMLMEGVDSIPRQVWDWGKRNRAGYLKRIEEFELYEKLLEVGQVTCLPTHLSLNGHQLRYKCEWTKNNNYQKKGGESPKLQCRYMRHSMDTILIATPDGFKVATMIGTLFQHVSKEDVDREEKIINSRNIELRKKYKEKLGENRALIEDLQRDAKAQQEKINVNQANTQNIRMNRGEEIEHETKNDRLRHEEYLAKVHGLSRVTHVEENLQQHEGASSTLSERANRVREKREQRIIKGKINES
jgi:hypothetical protein